MKNDINYLYNKLSNYRSSLDLNKLPEVDRNYIYKQILEYSQILFLIREIDRGGTNSG